MSDHGYPCQNCGTLIAPRISASEPWDWDESYKLRWISGPQDDRTKVIDREHGEQRFPNVGHWYFCSAECLNDADLTKLVDNGGSD